MFYIAAGLDVHPDTSGVLRWISVMATTAQQVGIRNSWSLLAFAKSHGKMQIGDFVNKETGESKAYLIPYGSRIKVTDRAEIEAGDELTEGYINPHSSVLSSFLQNSSARRQPSSAI